MKVGDIVYCIVPNSITHFVLKANTPYVVERVEPYTIKLYGNERQYLHERFIPEREYNIMKRKDKLQKLLYA